jgi:hypothetical protein
VIFVAIAATHASSLDEPPYVEQAMALWSEASYLADTHFDFASLRFDELHGELGGPRFYVCSVVPALLAALMLATNSATTTIWVAHIVSIACAAAIGAALYSWLVPVLGRLRTLLVLTAMYVLPMMAAQLEMVGLDIPQAAASMPYFALVRRRRWSAAALASWLAFAIKPSGFLLPLALCTYVVWLTVAQWMAGRRQHDALLLRGGLVAALSFVAQFVIMKFGDNLFGRVHWFADLGHWWKSIPDLLIVLFFCALGTGYLLLRTAAAGGRGGAIARMADLLAAKPLFAIAWIVLGGTIAASMGTYFEVRHLLLVVPLTALIAGMLLADLPGVTWQCAILTAVIACFLSNRFGRWYPEFAFNDARGFGLPERSLEYRADQRSNREAVALLERDHAGEPMLVTEIFTTLVLLPRLGYVSRPYVEPHAYCFAAIDDEMWRIFDDQPGELIVARLESQLGRIPFPAYAIPLPAAGDEVLDDDKLRPPRLVYRKRFSRDGSPADRLRQYVDFLYSQSTELDAVGRLIVVGNLPIARRLAALEKGWTETDPQLPNELLARLDLLRDQLATPSRMAVDTTYDAAELAAARERLLQVVEQRRAELTSGKPLKSLEWGQRSRSSTLAQRLLYVPASKPRSDVPSAAAPWIDSRRSRDTQHAGRLFPIRDRIVETAALGGQEMGTHSD